MVNTGARNVADGCSVVMFTGKGGVGKTTCAAATALHYASLGKRTLAISTDPTPSLSHIFEVKHPQSMIEVSDNLYLDEIGVQKVKEMWDGRFGHEVHEVFSSFVDVNYAEFVEFVTDVLPGMRDEFMVDYIRELTVRNEYDKIIWDTAPLGQTLGLLTMPAMLGKHLRMAPRVYSRLKMGDRSKRSVLDIIKGWEELSVIDMNFLRRDVEFALVTIPEALAVEQLDDVFWQFGKHELQIGQLIINNVIKDTTSEFLRIKARQQQEYIKKIRDKYPNVRAVELPLFPREIRGINGLIDIERNLFAESGPAIS